MTQSFEQRLITLERLVENLEISKKGIMSLSQGWQGEHLVLRKITLIGGIVPASMADTVAENGTIYYSTTASKLVYKDLSGTVNNLY